MKVILVDKCRNCPFVKTLTGTLWWCTIRTEYNRNIAVMVDPDTIPDDCPLLDLKDIKGGMNENRNKCR